MRRLTSVLMMVWLGVASQGSACLAEDRVIHGCTDLTSGILRIVEKNVQCRDSESPISWSKYGTVHVYDRRKQYLGTLLGGSDNEIQIFIPSLGAAARIDLITRNLLPTQVQFGESGCQGTPYALGEVNLYRVKSAPVRYFLVVGPQSSYVCHSYLSYDTGECKPGNDLTYKHLKAVEIPGESIPFRLPIALPLSFSYE